MTDFFTITTQDMLLMINHNQLIMFVIIGIRYAKVNIMKERTNITNVLEKELPIVVCKGIEKSLCSHASSQNKCKAEKIKLCITRKQVSSCMLTVSWSKTVAEEIRYLKSSIQIWNHSMILMIYHVTYSTGIKKQSLLQYSYIYILGVHFCSRIVEPQSLVVAENI